jgi:hypothetical protein
MTATHGANESDVVGGLDGLTTRMVVLSRGLGLCQNLMSLLLERRRTEPCTGRTGLQQHEQVYMYVANTTAPSTMRKQMNISISTRTHNVNRYHAMLKRGKARHQNTGVLNA